MRQTCVQAVGNGEHITGKIGHREGSRIAHITSQPGLYITKERLAGYKAALEQHGLPFDEQLVKYCFYTREEVDANLDSLFSLPDPPDAFLTVADRFALGYFAGLKRRHIRIPEQVSFIGFSNLSVAELLDPSMTTVFQPAFDMGRTAANLLLDLIEKKTKMQPFETVQLQTELFVRGSSVALALP